MTFNNSNQFRAHMNGAFVEHGKQAFTTTGLTVEVPTGFKTILDSVVTARSATAGITEVLYCDNVITEGKVTVTRYCTPIIVEGGGTDPISTYNWLEVPIGICPVAGVMTGLYWYNGVKPGGSPLMEVGKVPGGGAGTADQDWFVDSADDGTNSHVLPNSSVGKSIIALTAATNGHTAVAAGDLITASTTGAGTSDGSGLFIQATITPTPTSALEVSYIFFGLY